MFRRLLAQVLRRPVPAAAAGAICIAFSAILFRLAGVSPSTGAVLRCGFAIPPLVLIAAAEGRGRPALTLRDRLPAIAAGLFFAADLIMWHHSIDDVGAGLATVLGNAQVVMVPLAAWMLLREPPSSRVLVAIPLAAVGVLLISGVVGSHAFGSNPPRGTVFGVLTAVAYTGFILTLRSGGRTGRLAQPLCDATIAATVAAAVAGALLGELDLHPLWPAWGWLLVLAIESQVLGWLLISISFPRLPVALTSVVLTVQPAGSLFLAALIFAEAPSALQLGGAALLISGVVIATSRRRARVATAPDAPINEAAASG